MSTNISKEKREELLREVAEIRSKLLENKDENTEKLLVYLSNIEKDIDGKKYGLVFEEHREAVDELLLFNITIVINALMVIFYDISSPLVVQLIIKKKHKMTDEQISDEILLAITEERLNDLMKDGEKQLSKEEITNLAKEVIAKIKEREELENKEKTNELDA